MKSLQLEENTRGKSQKPSINTLFTPETTQLQRIWYNERNTPRIKSKRLVLYPLKTLLYGCLCCLNKPISHIINCPIFSSVRTNATLALASSKVKPETFDGWKWDSVVFSGEQRHGELNKPRQQTSYRTSNEYLVILLLKLLPRPPRTNRTNDAAMFALQPFFSGQRRDY